MTATITVALEPGPDTFGPVVDAIIAKGVDLLPAFEVIYATFLAMQRARFEAEGPDWRELADSTVRQRERLGIGGNHPILDRTGASVTGRSGRTRKTYGPSRGGRSGGQLKRSLTTEGAPGAEFRPGPTEVFMGTSDPVARFHQDGTDRMPARPLVDVSVADEAMWSGIVSDYLFGGPLFADGAAGSVIGPVGL